MLSKNDMSVFRGVFGEMLRENNTILQRETRDLIAASEKRIIGDVEDRITAAEARIIADLVGRIDSRIAIAEGRIIGDVIDRISAAEQRIVGDVSDFIGSSILPQIDEHNMRISRLERHTMLIA